MSCFRFIAPEKANYPISLLCRMIGVSRSGFHAWQARPPSERTLADARLSGRIGEIHKRSCESYGVRRVHLDLGWSMRDQMPAELVVDALEMAISRRRPAGQLVHHSDQGSQYVALIFGQRLRKAGIAQSDGLEGRLLRQRRL